MTQNSFSLLFKPFLVFFILASSQISFALSEEEEMAAIQKQLNADVLSKQFNPGDVEKVDKYIEESMKKDLKPVEKSPSYWKPGMNCNDLYRYSWRAYRDCRYYYRYYGYYW